MDDKDSVVFVYKITGSMCEWLNDNHVVHNISTRMVGWQTCMSLWMSGEDMIYFKLKWDEEILSEETMQKMEDLYKGLKHHGHSFDIEGDLK